MAILALAVTKADLLFGFFLLLFYALGRSLPLLMVGTVTGLLKSIMDKQSLLVSLQKFGGIIIIGLGAYFTLLAK